MQRVTWESSQERAQSAIDYRCPGVLPVVIRSMRTFDGLRRCAGDELNESCHALDDRTERERGCSS